MQTGKYNLTEFFKVCGSIVFAGTGITLVTTSNYNKIQIIIGVVIIGIGIGLLFVEKNEKE